MLKLFLLLFIFSSFLYSSLIKDIEILEISNKDMNFNNIKTSKDFKRTRLPLIKHTQSNYFIKITLDKSKINKNIKSLEINSDFNFIEFEEHIQNNIYTNPVIDISKDNFIDVFYLKIINQDSYINFDIKVYNKDDFILKQIWINRFYGIAYGIIFASFLYYFALFLFNREKSYIYYSLTQLSMLFILISVSAREMLNDRFFMDIIFFSFFLFSNLFTKHFFNTKKNTPKLHFLLNLSILFYIFNLLFIYIFGSHLIEENFPFSILLVIYIITAVISLKKGYKPAIFYLCGWGLVIFSFLFIELQFYLAQESLLIKAPYLMHFVSPLESLILAFALSYKMKLAEEEKQKQEQFLAHQSKLASMGEMISNIAHQWRQPLTHISYIMMNLKTAFEQKKLSKEYFNKKNKEATAQLEFMSHTIDDFRNFFKVSKEKEIFFLNDAIHEVINLFTASLNANNISINFNQSEKIQIKSLKGEFLQVIFNIINNAKDEFFHKNIKEAIINITLKKNKNIIIEIQDNAQGIDEKIINKIFEPYFTTKSKGLGIGLYMSKMIIEKNISGKLEVNNTKEGASFKIILPLSLIVK